jgi:Flp pilus assembly protein TadD
MFLKRLFNFIPKSEFSRALGLFNSGQYRKALKKFEELREVSQQHADVDRSTLDLYACEAHVALGKECAAAGDLGHAIEELEAAVEIKPTFADLHYMLGRFYAQKKRLEDAEASFRRSLDVNNKFFRARVHLAFVLFKVGKLDEAVAELLASKLSCPNFYRDGLDGLINCMRTDPESNEADDHFHELLEERPSSAQISRELAIEAIQNGDNDEAIRELKKAIALKPDYPDLHNYLGIAYGNKGMVDDAVQEFETSLKINPYYLKARLNLALLYYENDRFEDAQSQLDEVLTVQPDNQLANNLLAELRALADGQA